MGTASEQGAIWGARAEDWAEANEPAWKDVYEAILDRAGVSRGTRYFDVGCGAGGALVAAVRRGAVVAGLDASPNLAAIARRRLPTARIEVGEMEALPFGDGGFDAVTFINSLQFAGDPVRALAEARRVASPGGGVSVVVWGPREDCQLVGLTMPAVFALLPPNPAAARAPRPWAEQGVIEGLMEQAGIEPEDSGVFDGPLAFPDRATALRAVLSASARAIAHAGVEAVADAVVATLPEVTQADGSVLFRNRFRWVRGVAG